jgi:ornithine cyclodeaminase/alanine dehydrogenase
MTTSPIYVTEAEVARLVTVKDAIEVLTAMFATWRDAGTTNLPRRRARLQQGAMNLMGAAYGEKNAYGLKIYSGAKGAQFHTLLYSARDGRLKAIIEADLFGQMRTGAASGLASKLMSNPAAHTLAVIGSGKQARAQAVAICAVRSIRRIAVFSPTAEHRKKLASELEKELLVETSDAPSAERCVAGASIVVTITNATQPVCLARWLDEGVHVNAAGANAADRREIDDDLVLRAAVKATDHVEQAKLEAAEYRELVEAGKLSWAEVRELGEFVTGEARPRNSPSELTLFKSLGIALEDVAFAALVYERALAQGVGRPIG